MSRRPRDWAPLAAADPVPGDPDAIRDEAAHARDTAAALRAQAAELRAIGTADGLEGRYADALRTGAAGLDHHLRQVAERYEHVHGHLTSWAGELDDLQDESARLLRRARTAADHPAADDPVHPCRAALDRLTGHRDARAAHYAGLINAACDDVIRDSRWEEVSDAVGAFLGNDWVSAVFDWLGYLTSAVGLLALCLTPAGWIVVTCAAVGVALTVKDVLAAATGSGSWLDVALDTAGALGGFALGRALKTMRSIRAATKLAAETTAAEDAGARVMREGEEMMRDSYRTTRSRTASRAAKARARQRRGALRGRANIAADAARLAERARAVPEPDRWSTLLAGGEKDLARDACDVNDMRVRFPHSQAVEHASRHAGTTMGAARGIYVGNTVLGDGSQYLGATSSGYKHLQDRFTMAVGSQW